MSLSSLSVVRPIVQRTATAIVSIACLAGMLVSASAAHAQGLYLSPAPTLPTGTVPQGVAAADFARSGFQSLVVTDSTNKNMKVYLGTGPATFAAAVTYSTCTGPTAVLAQDVNDDGYPDIVVACPTSNTVDLFINNGAGGFGGAPAATLTVTDPVAMTAGDFTGSGTLDAAVASGSGGVTIFLNIGGTLVTKTVGVTGTLSGITTADFNHDGHLDLAVSDSANNTVHVLVGDGTGTFTALGTYSTGAGTKPSGIVTADFNNDGNADVATSNAGNNTATILLGSATGALTAQAAQAAGTKPIAISVADVDSDGDPDVVAFDSVSATTGAIAVLLGNGNGTLQTAQISTETFVPGTLAAVADFNRDGKPDLAITQQTSNAVSLLLNNTLPTQYPDGRSFGAAVSEASGNGNMAVGITTGDFNKDGRLDLAVSYLEDNAVRVLLRNGTGFNTAAVYPVGPQPYWIASGDLNGDGYPDLVTANTNVNGATGTVSVLLSNSKTGTFAPAATYNVGRLPYQVAIGDVNGDGFPDLAVTNYGANTVSILLGSKTGTFTPAAATLATCVNPYGVAIGDFEHNGHPSVAVTCYASSELEVFPNNGNGTFGTPFITNTDTTPTSLVVGDFNRDGKLDIVVGNATANDIYFFAGIGNNTFAAGVESPSLNFPDSIAAGDVNGDGILDIVGVAPNFNAVEVTLGKGDGTFGTFQQRAAGQFADTKQPWAVALGDFNNDGQLDIVTANTFNQVNLALPAYQQRYMAEYPPVLPSGHPSVSLLTNISAANITLTASPASPLPYNNTGTTLTATVQPALSGGTPTGSVIFEDATDTPLGSGPYGLTAGVASAPTGRLGSGQYLFTTLYSGDASFQPTTASGAGFALTVSGTPVTIALNPSSVAYASTFNATVTVIGNATTGSYPHGTATIHAISGGSDIILGTTNTLQQVGFGNTSSRTITFTASAPELNVGSYQLYAIYNPSPGAYPAGSSSNTTLTVTGERTTLSLSCGFGLLSVPCTATVTASTTNSRVPAGNIVIFSVNGGTPTTETIGANGQANFSFNEFVGAFTVTANFPQQSNYLASSGSTSGGCIIICLLRTQPFSPFNALSGLGFNENFTTPAANRNTRETVPFLLF